MLNLYKEIYNLVRPIVSTYSEHYPIGKDKIYPYAEINIPNAVPGNEYANLNILQIDIWNNKSGQVQEIESITDSIYNILNKKKVMTDDMLIQIYRFNPCRLKLDDEDPHIQRRQLKFICKTYEF